MLLPFINVYCLTSAGFMFYARVTFLADLVRGLEDGEYTVQLAVGQCPELCIHYVTEEQRDLLTDMLQGWVTLCFPAARSCYCTSTVVVYCLIAAASLRFTVCALRFSCI